MGDFPTCDDFGSSVSLLYKFLWQRLSFSFSCDLLLDRSVSFVMFVCPFYLNEQCVRFSMVGGIYFAHHRTMTNISSRASILVHILYYSYDI